MGCRRAELREDPLTTARHKLNKVKLGAVASSCRPSEWTERRTQALMTVCMRRGCLYVVHYLSIHLPNKITELLPVDGTAGAVWSN